MNLCWLGGFGTPGPRRDGACAGPLAAAQNAVLPQASCSVVMSGLCGRLETTLRRPKKNEKMENRNTFSGRNTASAWVPTMPEPHRDLLRSSHVVWRPREGFRPIWGVLSDDEETSGSLPEFIDAANDVNGPFLVPMCPCWILPRRICLVVELEPRGRDVGPPLRSRL